MCLIYDRECCSTRSIIKIKYMKINILKQQPKQSNLMEISVPVPIYSSWATYKKPTAQTAQLVFADTQY